MLDLLASGEQAQWLKRKAVASAKPLAALWGAAGLAVILGAAGQLMLARALGPAGFGVIITANSVANMLGPFAAFGVGLLLIQKHGREGWSARRWVAPGLRLSAVCLLGATVVFAIWCMASLEQAAERRAALLLAPLVALFAGVQLAESRFRLEHRYVRVAGWQLSKHLSIFTVALIATLAGWTLLDVSIGLSVVSALIAAAAFWAGSGIGRERFLLKGHGARPAGVATSGAPAHATILAEAWPFAATSFVFLFFFQSSVAVVQWVSGTAAAGIYGVAISVMTPRIMAIDCEFSREVLGTLGTFFDPKDIVPGYKNSAHAPDQRAQLSERVRKQYQWDAVAKAYMQLVERGTAIYRPVNPSLRKELAQGRF